MGVEATNKFSLAIIKSLKILKNLKIRSLSCLKNMFELNKTT